MQHLTRKDAANQSGDRVAQGGLAKRNPPFRAQQVSLLACSE
jgi:hypothetical protein